MSKKFLIAAGFAALAGAVAEIAVHGYLDVMYKETIPQGLIKRLGNKSNEKDMSDFWQFTADNNEWVKQQPVEEINRMNIRGDNLKGYFLPAKEESDVFVLFAHGYRSSHEGDPVNFERFYHEQGYNFMSVDHTASGGSEGNFVGFGYFEAEDMLDWIYYLIDRFGEDIKIILHGVSMGGATVCNMASRVPKQVKLIVSDCAYTSAMEEFVHTANGAGVKKTGGLIKAFNLMNKVLAGYDLKETDVRESIKRSRVPMLFVHGDADDFVPTHMVYDLYSNCTQDKDLFIVKGAKHAQSIMVDKEGYENKLREFIAKYL